MVQKVNQLLNDKAWARWTALVLIASMMFFGYMFVDVMSPIQALMESEKGWGPDTFGTYAASEYIVNVLGFLIIAGVSMSAYKSVLAKRRIASNILENGHKEEA